MLQLPNHSHRKVTMPDKNLIAAIDNLSPTDKQALAILVDVMIEEEQSGFVSLNQFTHRFFPTFRQAFNALRQQLGRRA